MGCASSTPTSGAWSGRKRRPELGLIEAAAEGAALFVEWPENGEGFLPPADLALALSFPPPPEEPEGLGEPEGPGGARGARGPEGRRGRTERGLRGAPPHRLGPARGRARRSPRPRVLHRPPPEAEGADAAVRSSARSPSAP